MFRKIFEFFNYKVDKVRLGRWKITNHKINEIKTYLANIDNCGVYHYDKKYKDIKKF